MTGVQGFTGGYVRTELESAGWEVFGIDLNANIGNDHYRRVDLNDIAGLRELVAEVQPDAVVHLAGIAFTGHRDDSWKLSQWVRQ